MREKFRDIRDRFLPHPQTTEEFNKKINKFIKRADHARHAKRLIGYGGFGIGALVGLVPDGWSYAAAAWITMPLFVTAAKVEKRARKKASELVIKRENTLGNREWASNLEVMKKKAERSRKATWLIPPVGSLATWGVEGLAFFKLLKAASSFGELPLEVAGTVAGPYLLDLALGIVPTLAILREWGVSNSVSKEYNSSILALEYERMNKKNPYSGRRGKTKI